MRFLKKFKALADAVYRSGREIAFIDSEAADAENASPELATLGSGEHEPRWLYAVRKDTGLPLGLVAIRENGEDGEDREAEEEACTVPCTGDWRCGADGARKTAQTTARERPKLLKRPKTGAGPQRRRRQ